MHAQTAALIHRYYSEFNAGHMTAFLSLVDDRISHDINQGGREVGRSAFAAFMERMNAHYQERITDIIVMTDASGEHAAAEFTVSGRYLKTDPGLPEARGQSYILPAGTFFQIRNGRIMRISVHYNLREWIRQVSGP